MCSYLVPARSLTRTTDLLACSAADACRMRKRERERERQEKGHLACTLRASRSRKSVRDIGSNWETGAGKIQRWNKFPTKISAYALFARLAARMDTHTLHTRAALNMRDAGPSADVLSLIYWKSIRLRRPSVAPVDYIIITKCVNEFSTCWTRDRSRYHVALLLVISCMRVQRATWIFRGTL